MKNFPNISMNSLLMFMEASQRRRISIVKGQKQPATIRVAPYATARAAMRNYLKEGYNGTSITKAIQKLQLREPTSVWAKNDVTNSILALRHFVQINFPQHVGKIYCRFSKPSHTQCVIEGVHVTVSPDLILRWEENGTKYIGAIKFRIGKSKLTRTIGNKAASLLAHYLHEEVAQTDEVVDHAHCFFVDIMDDRLYTAQPDITPYMESIREACVEYGILWNAA